MIESIGSRVYYDIEDGSIIQITAERQGSYVEYTVEEEIERYKALFERNRDTFDYIQLEYGQYARDFAECNGCRVNVDTKQLEFSYPDPVHPEQQPVYRKPLSIEVDELKQSIAELSILIATPQL